MAMGAQPGAVERLTGWPLTVADLGRVLQNRATVKNR
jgi:hypothetical protein